MPESANEHLAYLRARLRADPPASILDVGVGRGNYGWFLRQDIGWTGRLTGLEIWAPYVVGPQAISGGNRTYYDGGITVGDMRERSEWMTEVAPDIIFAFDVIEHVVRDEGIAVIRAMQRAAKKAVLVCSPILPYAQGPYMGNPYEEHKHDWTVAEMVALGSEFRGRGACTGMFEFPAGRCDRCVTVMLNTVRDDEAFRGRNVLTSIADDLARQTFPTKELEFVAVDGLYSDRFETFATHSYPMRVLHVPPRPTTMVVEHRPAISAYKNSGLVHARGELVLTIDDGCRLDDRYVERCWAAWAERKCLSAMYHGITDTDMWQTEAKHNDSRKVFLGPDGKCVGPIGGNMGSPPGAGFIAFPLQAALALNGYDEMFDGSRGLEDIDFGMRLQMAGYRLALDSNHTVGLYEQGAWSAKLFNPEEAASQSVVKCAQTTFRIHEPGARPVVANRQPWSETQWARIAPRCIHLSTGSDHCTLFGPGHPCPYVGLCSDREHPGLRALRDDPPIFDLREMRCQNGIL
jgi:hypothetical protein